MKTIKIKNIKFKNIKIPMDDIAAVHRDWIERKAVFKKIQIYQ